MIFGVYTKIRIVRLFSTNFSHTQKVTSLKSGIKYEVECFTSLSEEYLHKKYGNNRDLGTWINWKLLQNLNLFSVYLNVYLLPVLCLEECSCM